jgi:hypothetical protein
MGNALRRLGDQAKVLGVGFMDKAKELLDQHDDKVDEALDKVGELAKGRFAGHDEQIDMVVDKLQEVTGGGDSTRPEPQGDQPR